MTELDEPDALEIRWPMVHGLVLGERIVAVFFLSLTFVLVLLQVVTRYVFSNPLPWTEELARFALVWLTFISAGFVMARRLHITVDLIANILGRRANVVLEWFSALSSLAVSLFMALMSVRYSLSVLSLHAPASRLPMPSLYSAGIVGFALLLLHGVLNSYVVARYPQDIPDTTEKLSSSA